jgi:peptidoglycan hydrolase CwlO-like protein
MWNIRRNETYQGKLTAVNKTVNVNFKVTDMEETLKMIDLRVTEIEKSRRFLTTEFDSHWDELKFAKSEIKNLKQSCDNFEHNSKKLFEKEMDIETNLRN